MRGPYKIKHAPGSIGALILAFYNSPIYRDWSPATVRKNDRFLRDLMALNAKAPVDEITRGAIVQMRDEFADTPATAANWLKCIRALLDYAIDLGIIEHNVARDKIKGLRPKAPGGFRSWQEHEIAAFLDHWRLGSIPHRVLTLALCTGAARVDLVKLGWQSIQGDRICYQRQKTERHEDEVVVSVRIMPELDALLATIPTRQMTFLETTHGRRRSELSLTNDMKVWVLQAGLGEPDKHGRHLNMHGLRKAMGRRLAEAGCSPYEIASILGHRSVRSSEPYTKAYNRAVAGDSAIDKLAGLKPSNVTRLKKS